MANAFDLFCDQKEEIIISIQENQDKQVYGDSVNEDQNLLNLINFNGDGYLNKQSNGNEELSFTQNGNYSQISSIQVIEQIPSSIFNFQSKSTHTKKETSHKWQKLVHLQDCKAPPRAVAMLPSMLYFKFGIVIPRRSLPTRVKFGPVIGVSNILPNGEINEMVLESARCNMPIYLKRNSDCVTYIDVTDKDKSNWFSLLTLGDQHTANVWLYQDGDELYGVTVRPITARTPLIIGYSKKYADDNGIPQGQPILDISAVLSEDLLAKSCECVSPTSSLLQRRNNGYHKNTQIRLKTRRGRYRCRCCANTFSRIFSLKRHMALYCTKKPGKVSFNKADTSPEVVPTATSLNLDDNRLPSDESLQNYTNGLDFSTSLFDTDRIPNLDISGSSRSETDFNLYGGPYKDDFVATGDLMSTVNRLDKQNIENEDRNRRVPNESIQISCEHCKQPLAREDKSEHLKECRKIRLKCECGRVYKDRTKLARHIHTHHRNSVPAHNKNNEDGCGYQCEKCEQSFKRRGMLVNHMWRVHAARACVPLERRVRHYPCVACPKLYRAASKRDKHVRRHHPGVELVKGGSIDGGTRACEPAACIACPRQYVTRAKLLQHMRAAHPALAPPKQKSHK